MLVNPDSDTLTNVSILLRDPTTNALKTLTDSDFTGGEYFVGIYARSVSGGVADISDHRATQSNSAGQSYYLTSGNPLTGAWVAYTANLRVGVRHLLLTSPVEGFDYAPRTEFTDQIPVPAPDLPVPTLALPPKFYLLAGREVSLYFDNVLPDAAADYEWDIGGLSLGQHQNERWTTNPSGAQSATTVTVSAIRRVDAVTVASGTTSVVGVAASANSGATKKCLFIGDSLTQADVMTQTLLDIAGTDVMGVTLLGTRGSGSNKHEGRGGWTISDYATAGRTFYSFTVSGVTVSPQINSTEYYNKLPIQPTVDVCLVLDPMLATGGSASATIDILKRWGARTIKYLGLIGAPEGVARLHADHPDVPIYLAALDERLNENGYIMPGLGDAGDRQFGT